MAQEQEEISAATLQQNLLMSLPERACENLLKRLEQQGYLQIVQRNRFSYHQTVQDTFANYYLTDFGKQCATDKSFWIGEKGVYNVFISKSNLVEQRIIRIEKIDRAEDDRNPNILSTPYEISQYEKKTLIINKTEVLFEDVEEKCFKLKPMNCILEIQSKGKESVLKLSKENQLLFQTVIDFDENYLQEELLLTSGDFEYDKDKKSILSQFDQTNLSFKRKILIDKPFFNRNQFNQIELENISYIPSDENNADLWYLELLYKNMNDYFFDEDSFNEFSNVCSIPFQLYFNLNIPTRKDLVGILKSRNDTFYQIAKLETIHYLNY